MKSSTKAVPCTWDFSKPQELSNPLAPHHTKRLRLEVLIITSPDKGEAWPILNHPYAIGL